MKTYIVTVTIEVHAEDYTHAEQLVNAEMSHTSADYCIVNTEEIYEQE